MKKSTKKKAGRCSKPLPKLSATEWAILELLWRHGPITGAQIRDGVNEIRKRRKQAGLSTGAVRSYLNRLSKTKKMIRRIKEIGYELKFEATHDRETLVRNEIARFTDKCFGGDLSALFAAVRKMK